MRKRPLRWPLTITTLLLAALVLACQGERSADTAIDAGADLSVEEVYARFAQAITRPGHVYHAVVEASQEGGLFSSSGTTELWVDTERDLARHESEFVYSEGPEVRTQSIIVEGAVYRSATEGQPASKVEASKCHGANAAVSSVIGCPGPTEESTKTVERGRYEGQDVIVVVTTGTSYGSDETFTFTTRLYLDGETLLPIALESEGTADYGEVYPTSGHSRYENEFVSADSLPEDFFDPASSGYVERDPEAPLRTGDAGISVYWLGREYSGTKDLPPLSLAIAYIRDTGRPGFRASLEYKLAKEEFGTPAIALQEWDAEEWDTWMANSRGGNWWEWPCREKKELTADGRRTVVYMGFEDESIPVSDPVPTAPADVICPQQPYDRFMAHIYLGSTVVTMRAGQVCSRQGCVESPYDSLEGIEAVARALQLRE